MQFFCDFQWFFISFLSITFFLLFFFLFWDCRICCDHLNVGIFSSMLFSLTFLLPSFIFQVFFLLFQFLFSKKIICFIFIFRGDRFSNGFAQKAPARVFLQKLQRRHGTTESNQHFFPFFWLFFLIYFMCIYVFIIYVSCFFTILYRFTIFLWFFIYFFFLLDLFSRWNCVSNQH